MSGELPAVSGELPAVSGSQKDSAILADLTSACSSLTLLALFALLSLFAG